MGNDIITPPRPWYHPKTASLQGSPTREALKEINKDFAYLDNHFQSCSIRLPKLNKASERARSFRKMILSPSCLTAFFLLWNGPTIDHKSIQQQCWQSKPSLKVEAQFATTVEELCMP